MLRQPLIWFVKGWRRVVSPMYGDVCKFHPTCSAYGLRALETHGALKGSALAIWRILRCHPWSKGGVDYVPGTEEAASWRLRQHEGRESPSPTETASPVLSTRGA